MQFKISWSEQLQKTKMDNNYKLRETTLSTCPVTGGVMSLPDTCGSRSNILLRPYNPFKNRYNFVTPLLYLL